MIRAAMTLYPAIDMKEGRAVRLIKGERDQVTDYGLPLEAALRWKQAGARWLHMVDLDGAFDARGKNLEHVKKVVLQTGLSVQLGGGIRTMEDITARLEEAGVARVILGTVALSDPKLVERACARYPGCIACGIDAREGKVAIRGWVEQSERSAVDLALEMKDLGIMDIIYTDISRDGMLSGPNMDATGEMVQKTRMRIIGSGGISNLEDIIGLKKAGCAGAILGKALYEGRFTLETALKLEEGIL